MFYILHSPEQVFIFLGTYPAILNLIIKYEPEIPQIQCHSSKRKHHFTQTDYVYLIQTTLIFSSKAPGILCVCVVLQLGYLAHENPLCEFSLWWLPALSSEERTSDSSKCSYYILHIFQLLNSIHSTVIMCLSTPLIAELSRSFLYLQSLYPTQ